MAQTNSLKNSAGFKNYKVKNNRPGRFKRLVQNIGNSRKSQAIAFVAVFGIFGGGFFIVKNYAASIYPTGPNDIIIEKNTTLGNQIKRDNTGQITQQSPLFDLRLYGDGHLICGQTDGVMKESTLTPEQIDNVFNKLLDAGMTNSQNFISRAGPHVKATSVVINTALGANQLSYEGTRSGQPAIVTNVNKILGELCANVSDPATAANPAPLSSSKQPPVVAPNPKKRNVFARIINQRPKINPEATPQYVKPRSNPFRVSPQQVPVPKNYKVRGARKSALSDVKSIFAVTISSLKNLLLPTAKADTINWNDETDQYNRINQSRSGGLARSDCLTKGARDWAIHNSASLISSKTIIDAPQAEILKYCGNDGWQVIGSNTGFSGGCHTDDSQDGCSAHIFDLFMADPTHHQNIVDSRWNTVGTGAYRDNSGNLVVVHFFAKAGGGNWDAQASPDSRSHDNGSSQQSSNPPTQVQSATPPPTTAPIAQSTSSTGGTAVVRFFNFNTGDHFWSIDPGEIAGVASTKGWQCDFGCNAVFYAYLPSSPPSGSIPVYRFRHKDNTFHFFTANKGEADSIDPQYHPESRWIPEGIAFYVPASSSVPVLRFYYDNGNHFWSADPAEQDRVGNHTPGWHTEQEIPWYSAQ